MSEFEWDEEKSKANRKARGFGFELAQEFDFSSAVILVDDRKDYGETRFRAFGFIGNDVYNLVFTKRSENLRVISLRRCHEKEAKRYGLA